ncbi:UvrD-helicase domain-containing protein [Microbulbifer sp. PAAF003]|uniref:UvrD-helicase domain-containing protein n=1 Tax=Microbulbifer sp. PAAF003 TaxID=3243375 RepID=UPI0040390EF3
MSTVKVAISSDFMLAFSRVPKSAQKKVMEFVTKFRQDPRSPGINYETINDARDGNYRSVRVDKNYRGIILKPDEGDVFLLLWVDKHDDAYDWARRHKCQINPSTGSLQVFASTTTEEVSATELLRTLEKPLRASKPPVEYEPVAHSNVVPPRVENPHLIALSDDQRLQVGVPTELLPLVRAVRTEEELEELESSLPVEAYEALYLLAAGTAWEEIEREYVRHSSETIDTSDIAAALDRPETQRSFHVVHDELELIEMLEAPLERWRVFLHPSQFRLVNRNWNGPVRVLGGAGTGKTVVAMHRAKWLVKNALQSSDEKVLFTTFTANLATDIESSLRKICSAEEMQRIEVKHIDRWVNEFLRRQKYPADIVYPDSNRYGSRDGEYKAIWDSALQLCEAATGLPNSFYKEEWERVILPQRVMTKLEYFKASRAGRGVALSRKQRAAIWPVFEEVRARLQLQGLKTFEDATLDAADILSSAKIYLPYRSVIVDEAQDMGPEALTLIRKLVPEQADDIFVVGDGHQRIYRRKAVMSKCGIQIVGRSRKLRINYRTTEQTRRFATSVLENVSIDNLDGSEDTSNDYRSLIQGLEPQVKCYADFAAESEALVQKIKSLVDSGVTLQDICITARTVRLRDQFTDVLKRAGIATVVLKQQNDNRNIPGVRIATMHRVKGLEFRYVFILAANKGVIPLKFATGSSDDPVEMRQLDLNERALLHVAATRAIRELYISAHGTPSPYFKEVCCEGKPAEVTV